MPAQIRDNLPVTPRSVLRDASCVNLHSSWDEAPWNSKAGDLADAVIGMGFGWARDALYPHNEAQQAFHQALVDAGVNLHLNVTSGRRAFIMQDVQYLSTLPYAAGVGHLAGPNEPNASQSGSWPAQLASAMATLADARDLSMPDAVVTGMGLKHEHVHDYDADLIAARPAAAYVDPGWLAFHYYPGGNGPVSNAAEWARAEAGYGAPVGIHEETGIEWTQEKDPDARARFYVETLLRNYVSGIALTNLYELADDSTGDFGLVGTPAEVALQKLLATQDGGEDFVGRLSHADDCSAVVTSDGGGAFTVYLLKAVNEVATLVVDPAFQADSGGYVLGDAGNKRYTVGLVESMTTVHVTPAT